MYRVIGSGVFWLVQVDVLRMPFRTLHVGSLLVYLVLAWFTWWWRYCRSALSSLFAMLHLENVSTTFHFQRCHQSCGLWCRPETNQRYADKHHAARSGYVSTYVLLGWAAVYGEQHRAGYTFQYGRYKRRCLGFRSDHNYPGSLRRLLIQQLQGPISGGMRENRSLYALEAVCKHHHQHKKLILVTPLSLFSSQFSQRSQLSPVIMGHKPPIRGCWIRGCDAHVYNIPLEMIINIILYTCYEDLQALCNAVDVPGLTLRRRNTTVTIYACTSVPWPLEQKSFSLLWRLRIRFCLGQEPRVISMTKLVHRSLTGTFTVLVEMWVPSKVYFLSSSLALIP